MRLNINKGILASKKPCTAKQLKPMTYERSEYYSKVALNGTTVSRIIKERSGSGIWEFLGAIAFITMCILSGDTPLQFPAPTNTDNHHSA